MTLRSSSLKSAGTRSAWALKPPKEVPVHRREVFDAIHRNEVAAGEKADKVDPAGNGGGKS